MLLRHVVVIIVIVAVGCSRQEADSPTSATTDAGDVTAQELCDAYLKGDERFTGKIVNVTGYLVGYEGGVGVGEKNVTLGTDRDGNSLKWVGFKVTSQEFARMPTWKFGEIIKVKGICAGAKKKEDALLVRLRDCRFITPAEEEKTEKTQP